MILIILNCYWIKFLTDVDLDKTYTTPIERQDNKDDIAYLFVNEH